MGFPSDNNKASLSITRMVGINHSPESFHPSLPIQQQPAGTFPIDCSIDEKISANERLSSTFIVNNFTNDVIPEAPEKERLEEPKLQPEVTETLQRFATDSLHSHQVFAPETSILDVTVANIKDISSLDLEVELEENGAHKEENKLCAPRLSPSGQSSG